MVIAPATVTANRMPNAYRPVCWITHPHRRLCNMVSDADAQRAEYTVLAQGRNALQGLGRQLPERLLHIDTERGVGRVHGDVPGDSEAMLGLVKSLGFAIPMPTDDPSCRLVQITTRPGYAV